MVFRGFDFGFLLSFVWVYTLVVFGVKRHGLIHEREFQCRRCLYSEGRWVWGMRMLYTNYKAPLSRRRYKTRGLEMGWV
jgi:hypothetical protein